MDYKPIILPYISFMFIEMKFIHYHSYVMFVVNSMSICLVLRSTNFQNFDENI